MVKISLYHKSLQSYKKFRKPQTIICFLFKEKRVGAKADSLVD